MKHASKFDGIDSQLRFHKIEQFKKSLHMQETLSLLQNYASRYLK